MAVFALTSTYTSINGTDYSAYLSSSTLAVEVSDLDKTSFASAGWTEVFGGLKGGTLTLNVNDDVAAAAVDSLIWPLLGTNVAFEVRPTSAVVGTSNPKWTGTVMVKNTAIGGNVGDKATKSLTWPTSGAVTRATS